jgi:SAM-dependent methyltransferase
VGANLQSLNHITDYLHYALQLVNGYRADGEKEIATRRRRDISPYLNGDRPLRILDLANGRLRPQYLLLKAAGHQVYGIDLVNQPESSWVDMAYSLARWIYIRKLGLTAEATAGQTLVCGDVAVLPFSDNSFDFVTSVAGFEHFLDVPSVVTELARVVRPGGLVWVGIHLFTSPSGGHNLSLTEIPLRTIPAGVGPWDHLRRRRLPFHVPLNEWRKDQYLETFAGYFEIVKHYCVTREGEKLLTPRLEAELSTYSRDELTCRSYIILARKAS